MLTRVLPKLPPKCHLQEVQDHFPSQMLSFEKRYIRMLLVFKHLILFSWLHNVSVCRCRHLFFDVGIRKLHPHQSHCGCCIVEVTVIWYLRDEAGSSYSSTISWGLPVDVVYLMASTFSILVGCSLKHLYSEWEKHHNSSMTMATEQ